MARKLLILASREPIPDRLLEKVSGRSGIVDFMMLETAKCPNCKQTLTEKTLIEPKLFSTSDNVV